MKIRIDKIIDVKPMSRQEAEAVLGVPINNLLHEDNGYLISGTTWLPAYVIDGNSRPYHTDGDKIEYYTHLIYEMIRWFRTKPNVIKRLPKFLNSIATLTYEINEEDGINSKNRRGSGKQYEGRPVCRFR